jgi:predicted Holliday junction resolvase-like endonuclease
MAARHTSLMRRCDQEQAPLSGAYDTSGLSRQILEETRSRWQRWRLEEALHTEIKNHYKDASSGRGYIRVLDFEVRREG